jgi:hypothetical protein
MEAARAESIAMLAEEDLDPARWRRPSGDGSCPEWDSAGRNPTAPPPQRRVLRSDGARRSRQEYDRRVSVIDNPRIRQA